MNRIYKVIFNRSLGLYQVVSEIARNHGRASSRAERGRKSLVVPFVLSSLPGLTVSALAE
ncbi:ESPR domain-containing protein [uncultured Dialister sp.]|uniref:ESPR domain-containing protein n=1 Tax=uncultured Dialister sp. TaxID=278064 RepID=UPI00344CD1C0